MLHQVSPASSVLYDSRLKSEIYHFPHHITPTNLRPDVVWWSEQKKELWLLKLTVSFETRVADARASKRAKYHDLVVVGRDAGYRVKLITTEVGSRGMMEDEAFNELREAIEAPRKVFTILCLQIIRATILESFNIWGCRNVAN